MARRFASKVLDRGFRSVQDPSSQDPSFGRLNDTPEDSGAGLGYAALFAIAAVTGGVSATAAIGKEPVLNGTLTAVATVAASGLSVLSQPPASFGDLDGVNGFTIGNDSGNYSSIGYAVSGLGDVNGDGLDDVIVGVSTFEGAGESYVVFGRAAGGPASLKLSELDGSNGFRIDGAFDGDDVGRAVGGAGDVNGDGFDDIIVGGVNDGPYGFTGPGQAYVVFGSDQGFPASLALATLDGTDGFRIEGEELGDYAGRSVSGAGDINGDGFDDLVVGAPFAGPRSDPSYPGAAPGRGYVVFGKAAGFAASLDLASLDGSNGFRLDGEALGDQAGWSVSGAGDINGDGFDDVLVSDLSGAAGPYGGAYYGNGRAYVVFGRAAGFTAALDLQSLDGSDGFSVVGADPAARLGFSVSDAGDVNGDGLADFVLGAPGNDGFGGPASAGDAYVVFGTGGPQPASLDLSTLDGSNGFRIAGVDIGDRTGWSVGGGDVNGDGLGDLILGARSAGATAGPSGKGEAVVVFGSDQGFAPIFYLTSIDGISGFRILGSAASDRAGSSVSAAGDLDGDGFGDFLVGASGVGAGAGEVYVVFGGAFGLGTLAYR